MSQTNLKTPLEYKYALLAGELKEKESEVARIQTLYEQLPALSARAQRIVHLLECAEELLKEIDPTWTPARVKAVKPNVHKAPVAIGRISKTALDVLREAGRGADDQRDRRPVAGQGRCRRDRRRHASSDQELGRLDATSESREGHCR